MIMNKILVELIAFFIQNDCPVITRRTCCYITLRYDFKIYPLSLISITISALKIWTRKVLVKYLVENLTSHSRLLRFSMLLLELSKFKEIFLMICFIVSTAQLTLMSNKISLISIRRIVTLLCDKVNHISL